MAVDAATVWEIRSTGNAANGGGFADLDPGTSVDYSQQDSPQLSVTDIATDVGGTGVSSATGGFTAAMVGNTMYIGGGSTTQGWYQITAFSDTNNVTIDRSAGSSASGGDGRVGGAWKFGSTTDDDFWDDGAAGNTYYIQAGTHSLGESISLGSNNDWSDARHIIGYNTTRGDDPEADNRPLIAMTTRNFALGALWVVRNLRFSMTTGAFQLNQYAKVYNCKFFDAGSSKTGNLVSGSSLNCIFVQCEFVGTAQASTVGLLSTSTYPAICHYCYFHGAGTSNARGVSAPNTSIMVGCIFDSLAAGAYANGAGSSMACLNCLFYNCATGVHEETLNNWGIVNTIFHSCTTGVNGSATGEGQITYKCCFYNNTADINNGSIDASDITSDPLLADPSNQDFTLATSSPCFDTGAGLGTAVGLPAA